MAIYRRGQELLVPAKVLDDLHTRDLIFRVMDTLPWPSALGRTWVRGQLEGEATPRNALLPDNLTLAHPGTLFGFTSANVIHERDGVVLVRPYVQARS